MEMVLAGDPSKKIAADLNLSQRTVESHRASIMEKMGANRFRPWRDWRLLPPRSDATNFDQFDNATATPPHPVLLHKEERTSKYLSMLQIAALLPAGPASYRRSGGAITCSLGTCVC
jgi:hypothetical protein